MKRIISILLSVVFIFSLSACKDKNNDKDTSGVDIEYYANSGSMPETNYYLGTDPQKIKDELSALAANSEEEFIYDVVEGETNVLIDNGTFNYYYKKAEPDKGINYIVNYDTAFGIEIGSVIVEVKNAFKNVDFIEEPLNEENAFFVFGAQEGTVLKAKFAQNSISFVFVDNALCATAIYNN